MKIQTFCLLSSLFPHSQSYGWCTLICSSRGPPHRWTFYKGQSPCQIWGNLQAACNPGVSVGKLDTSVNIDATYPSPSGANATACQCNVVAYNLMAGCSWCQPNVYSTNWVSELQWKSGCSSYDPSGQLPSQASVLSSSIPPWALEQENGNSWEEFDASSIAVAGTTPTPTLDVAAMTVAMASIISITTPARLLGRLSGLQ
ncbi:hypothetical protein K439DRAFT_1061020 [Ramaria rubella]|nr:hypothetical protein K439DRAFT_1061020 [Ramaria rubella]